jgi:hypothetical protein
MYKTISIYYFIVLSIIYTFVPLRVQQNLPNSRMSLPSRGIQLRTVATPC